MAWGIYDSRDDTWMICMSGWTRKPGQATSFSSSGGASAVLDQLASSRHTPKIKPRELPVTVELPARDART